VQTLAAGDTDTKSSLSIGEVAHIRAAAPDGPRFDPNMTSDQRKDAANAIYLCANCATMIDKNGGADYPAEVLHEWKEEHEDWVRAHLSRQPDSPLSIVAGTHEAHGEGEVTALEIQGPAIIKPGTISRASGQGIVTGTRISPPRKE
jgi:hypothetical protein